MKCPTCPTSTLVITERSNVEIDDCPQGRGVDAADVRQRKHRKTWLGEIFD